MNWDSVFGVCYRKHPGAGAEELMRFAREWNNPLSPEEKADITGRQRNPFPVTDPLHSLYRPFDPGLWTLPGLPLPALYLEFLSYSNGGEFGNGERFFQFFGTADLRAMMLAYEFPQYMSGGVPFAMDGSGHHYIWDMRSPLGNGEYPILAAHSGNLGYDDAARIADSFKELCRGTESVEDILYKS
jgi:hypothetical protein